MSFSLQNKPKPTIVTGDKTLLRLDNNENYHYNYNDIQNVKTLTKNHYNVIMTVIAIILGGASVGITSVLKLLIPITQFNKGKASQLFSRVQKGETLVVLKNNTPVAVVISPEDYEIIEEYKNKRKGGEIC